MVTMGGLDSFSTNYLTRRGGENNGHGSCRYKMFVPFGLEKGPQAVARFAHGRIIFIKSFTIVKH